MKCELRDARTLVITPESVAEQEILMRFEGRVVRCENPQPFEQNVKPLVVEALPCQP